MKKKVVILTFLLLIVVVIVSLVLFRGGSDSTPYQLDIQEVVMIPSKIKAQKSLKQMRPQDYFEDSVSLKLITAIEQTNLSEIKRYAKEGANLSALGKDSITPLMWAISKKKKDSFSELLINGADPNALLKDGHTAVTFALSIEDTFYLKTLLSKGGDPNAVVPVWEQPALLAICTNQNSEILIKILVEAGADVNCQDPYHKNTPLWSIASAGNPKLIPYLLSHGADPTLTNHKGSTPLDRYEYRISRGILSDTTEVYRLLKEATENWKK